MYFKEPLLISTGNFKLFIEDNKLKVMYLNNYTIAEYEIVESYATVSNSGNVPHHMPYFELASTKTNMYIKKEEETRIIQLLNNYILMEYARQQLYNDTDKKLSI